MLNKLLESGYNSSLDIPAAAIIPAFKGGLDKQSLAKRASIFDAEYDKFDRRPGHTYIHLISVAAGEHYGPNSRADFYNGDSYKHIVPHPEKGAAPFIILKPGLSATHDKTFMEHGGVYTEHKSSLDGVKPQGYIVKAAINPVMKRGELIIGVETAKWEDDIQKLESGNPLKFSIGASAPYDICSVCGHITTTEAGHCEHYKTMPGEFLEDGSQVYVISDNCLFHDISRVKNPAEKIAFSIRKVASGRGGRFSEPVVGPVNASVVRALCVGDASKKRFDMLKKLAAIEKEITAQATAGAIDPIILKLLEKWRARRRGHRKSANCAADSLKNFLDFANHEQIIGACNNKGYIMSPEEFVDLMLPAEDKCGFSITDAGIKAQLPGMLNDILHSVEADTFCNDTAYDCPCSCHKTTEAGISRYCSNHSIGDLVDNIIDEISTDSDLQNANNKVIITISNNISDSPERAVAQDYLSYLVSAAQHSRPEDMLLTLMDSLLG